MGWEQLLSLNEKFKIDGLDRIFEVRYFLIFQMNIEIAKVHIQIFCKEKKIMVHRKIRENETSLILRNVTTHDIGIEFDVAMQSLQISVTTSK